MSASPLQRYPAGLLELIGAKNNGQAPSRLSDETRGVFDLTQFMGKPESVNGFGASVVEGASVVITVPSTEYWLLYAASIHATLAVAMTNLCMSIQLGEELTSPNPQPSIARGQVTGPFTSSGRTVADWTAPYPMILAPGTTIWGLVEQLAGVANVATRLRARIVRLQ